MVAPYQRIHASALKAAEPIQWLLPGVFASSSITLLTGQWKGGKTTFLSVMLGKMGTGGTLAGRPVRKGSALIVSEETQTLWRERYDRVGFTDNVEFICRPFRGRPSRRQWEEIVEDIATAPHLPDLVAFDPLAKFLPGHSENYAPALIDAIGPLDLLTDRGVCVALPHHPNKSGGRDLISRGSGALNGEVDIEAKFHLVPDALNDRVRRVETKSRPFGFSQEFQIEMTPDGLDYLAVEEEPNFLTYEFGLQVVKAMLEDAGGPMTRQQLWEGWLEDFDRPSIATLRRWLMRAQKEGLIVVTGTGRQHDAFRYGLPGQKPGTGPMTREEERELWAKTESVLREAKARMRNGEDLFGG